MGGGGDDVSSGDFFAELDAAEARLALEKTQERLERLRSGKGFRDDEEDFANRDYVLNHVEQSQYDEQDELQRLAEEDLAQRHPAALSNYWLTQINENRHQERKARVDQQRTNWLTSVVKQTHDAFEITLVDCSGDDMGNSEEQKEAEEEDDDDELALHQPGEYEDHIQYDSDDERLLIRALGGDANTIRKRFDPVVKDRDEFRASTLPRRHDFEDSRVAHHTLSPKNRQADAEKPSAEPLNNDMVDVVPKLQEDSLASVDTKSVSRASINTTVAAVPNQQSTREAVRDARQFIPSGKEVEPDGEDYTARTTVAPARIESELKLPSLDELEQELIQNKELPSLDQLMAEIDCCGNEAAEDDDLIEAHRACDENVTQPQAAIPRRKGMFSKCVEKRRDDPIPPDVSSSFSGIDVMQCSAEIDCSPPVEQPIDSGATLAMPSMNDLLSAIDCELQQDAPEEDSRDVFFQLGQVKKGDWSSSDEELSDLETLGSSVQPPCQESMSEESDEELQKQSKFNEEFQNSEEDRPGRFIHSSLTAMQARQKRKEHLREMKKQRYAEAVSAALGQRHRGRTIGSQPAGSTDQPQQSTGSTSVRPKKAATMPRNQTIGYPSSSGWSFGPGVNFSARPR